MRLVPVDAKNEAHVEYLWYLLTMRPPVARVSDDGSTTKARHTAFVKKHPYWDWCLIEVDHRHPRYPWWPWTIYTEFVGSTFISKPALPSVAGDELHVEIAPKHQGNGYAEQALLAMMEKHPRPRWVANVARGNFASMALFSKLGFSECQVTFEKKSDVVWPVLGK